MPLLTEMRVPTVLINNQHPGEFVHSVMIDNPAASLQATATPHPTRAQASRLHR